MTVLLQWGTLKSGRDVKCLQFIFLADTGIPMCRIGWWFLSLGLIPVFGLAQPAWIADDMVAYYPFDGNVRDASGNGNDGINVGATLTENRFGQPSSAYYFDGSDDFIEGASPGHSPSAASHSLCRCG